jgi:hypothetical protein
MTNSIRPLFVQRPTRIRYPQDRPFLDRQRQKETLPAEAGRVEKVSSRLKLRTLR